MDNKKNKHDNLWFDYIFLQPNDWIWTTIVYIAKLRNNCEWNEFLNWSSNFLKPWNGLRLQQEVNHCQYQNHRTIS